MNPAPRTGVASGLAAGERAATDTCAPRGTAATWWCTAAGLLGLQLLVTVPWSDVSPMVMVGQVGGGLMMIAAAATVLSRTVRQHLGGVEVLVITMAGLLTAAAVVAGVLLAHTTGLPGGYHPTAWGWSTAVALALAVAVLLVHVVRLALTQRDTDRLER